MLLMLTYVNLCYILHNTLWIYPFITLGHTIPKAWPTKDNSFDAEFLNGADSEVIVVEEGEIPSTPTFSAERMLSTYTRLVLEAMPYDYTENLKQFFSNSKDRRFEIGTLCSGSDSVVDCLQVGRVCFSHKTVSGLLRIHMTINLDEPIGQDSAWFPQYVNFGHAARCNFREGFESITASFANNVFIRSWNHKLINLSYRSNILWAPDIRSII